LKLIIFITRTRKNKIEPDDKSDSRKCNLKLIRFHYKSDSSSNIYFNYCQIFCLFICSRCTDAVVALSFFFFFIEDQKIISSLCFCVGYINFLLFNYTIYKFFFFFFVMKSCLLLLFLYFLLKYLLSL